jgi:hypothetical protein
MIILLELAIKVPKDFSSVKYLACLTSKRKMSSQDLPRGVK